MQKWQKMDSDKGLVLEIQTLRWLIIPLLYLEILSECRHSHAFLISLFMGPFVAHFLLISTWPHGIPSVTFWHRTFKDAALPWRRLFWWAIMWTFIECKIHHFILGIVVGLDLLNFSPCPSRSTTTCIPTSSTQIPTNSWDQRSLSGTTTSSLEPRQTKIFES